MKIVSIDVGIKNLAYCIMESLHIDDNDKDNDKDKYKIIKWDVINLCGVEAMCNSMKNDKIACNKKAVYSKDDQEKHYCKIHAKKQTNYIIPTSQFCIKKIKKMKLVELQGVCTHYKIEYPTNSKKEHIMSTVLQIMEPKFLDSIEKQSANDMNLIEIGIAIRKELDKIPTMMEVDKIIIENQISPIANRMKTIQGMIAQYFIMNNKTSIAFISSANKLKAFTKPLLEDEEKANYKDRKKASVEITLQLLENSINNEFKSFFMNHKKKDDLADSFLQGIWYLNRPTTTL